MNFLSGSKAAQRTRPTPATALRIQSSVNGTPRPFGYGQARIAANLLWTGNFTPVFVPSAGGGKGGLGGGGKSGGGGSYLYYTGVIFGLCEGPIDSIQQVWLNKTATSAVAAQTPGSGADYGFSYFDGDYQQLPWAWLAANVPSAAQNFRGIAYAASESFQLGTTTELPNATFDVRFAISGAVAEFFTVPGSPYQVTPLYFDWDYGVAVQFTVPNAAPFTFDFGNETSDTNLVTQSGLASGINPNDTAWAATNGVGVIWGDGATNGTAGQPLTKVTGTPTTGQYTVTPGIYAGNGVVWGFAAADAGQPVTIIAAAVSPGVYYAEPATMTLAAGSATAAAISAPASVPVSARLSAPGYLAEGTFVTGVTGGSATGTTTSGSATLSNTAGSFIAGAGTPIADSLGAIPGGATVVSATPPSVTVGGGATSALTAIGDTFTASFTTTGQQSGNQIIVASAAGIAPGSQVVVPVQRVYFYPVTALVLSVVGTTVTLDTATGYTGPVNDSFTFTTEFTGDVTAASATIANPSSLAGLSTSSTLTDSIGAFSASGVAVATVTQGAIVISANATANETNDVFSFGVTAALSQPALKSGAGVAVTVRGAALTQVLSSPAAGQFTLSVQAATFGTYTFNSADAGKSVLIIDKPDANPADVVVDFLTNPYYGMTQFPLTRIGDLSVYRAYCLANGLLVSPTITTPGAASQFLQDLMSATNAEMVWSGGLLTIVPYGDATITGNGATFTPNLTPLYSLDDDDFLDNQGSNPKSAASFASDDPVQVTRLDIYDQDNDIKVEYLDRAGAYNPTIVEAKDDAAIALFGLKNSGSKQLHLFCDESAALQSAQLMLGRTQVLRTFSFTVGREFILLDPMDIVEIGDAGAGLVLELVRITEITENQDRSLSITGEEVLAGAGSAPRYGRQKSLPPTTSFNVPAPNALAPIFFDTPVQMAAALGTLETLLATNGSGTNWGGADIWVASDNVNFKFAGTQWGGAAMGTLTAAFASGSDPDTVNTLSVDLTESGGALTGGTQQDTDDGHTLCLVDGELVTYQQATLTAANKYDLGKSGATPGYLRRGVYGSAIAAHASGAPFVRLRPGSYFTLPFNQGLVGSTIYVKLLSFNRYGGGKQTLDEVTSYAHVITGPPLPAAPSGFAAQQQGNLVAFAWLDLQDPSVTGYDLLYGPPGGNITTATPISFASRATETTTVVVPPGSWIFYLRARNIAQETGPAASAALTVTNPNTVIEAQGSFGPDWLPANCTLSGFLIHPSGVLVPDSTKLASAHTNAELFEQFVPFPVALPSVTYVVFDTGFVASFRVWMAQNGACGGNLTTESPAWIDQLDTWSSGSDPGTFANWTAGFVTSRHVVGRLVMNTAAPNLPGYVSSFTVTADNPADVYTATNFAVGSSGTTLTYASESGWPAQFHETPHLQVTPTSAGAVYGTATSVTETSAVIQLYNISGALVSGTANVLGVGP